MVQRHVRLLSGGHGQADALFLVFFFVEIVDGFRECHSVRVWTCINDYKWEIMGTCWEKCILNHPANDY